MSKGVHRVKDKSRVTRYYNILPYAEIVEILKSGDTAFFEDTREQPLKRQTIWKAAKKLSRMLEKKVVAVKGIMETDNKGKMEGYLFMVEEQS